MKNIYSAKHSKTTYLPEIVWRDKKKFAHGCASSRILEDHAEATISDQTFDGVRSQGEPVRSKEELLYYNIFQHYLPSSIDINLVGKWNQSFH